MDLGPSEAVDPAPRKSSEVPVPPVPATVLDSPKVAPGSGEVSQDSDEDKRDRTLRRGKKASAIDADQHLLQELAICSLVDAGGQGDCAFRAVAHSLACAQNKTVQGDSLIREAARLRTLAVAGLKQNPDFKATWAADPEEKPVHRAGAVLPAQTFDEYLNLVSKQSFYADGFLLQALATKIKSDLVIWTWVEDSEYWQRLFHCRWEKAPWFFLL